MQLIQVFRLIRVVRVYFLKAVKVIGAFLIDAFMYYKEFPVFYCNKCIAAEWAAQYHAAPSGIVVREKRFATYFAQELSFTAVVFIEVDNRSATARAVYAVRNITG